MMMTMMTTMRSKRRKRRQPRTKIGVQLIVQSCREIRRDKPPPLNTLFVSSSCPYSALTVPNHYSIEHGSHQNRPVIRR